MSGRTVLYVGTCTEAMRLGAGQVYQGRGRGIYRFEMDPGSGRLDPAGLTEAVMNPSHLARHPNGRLLLAVNELEEHEGQATGTLSSFALQTADGSLRLLNRQPTRGAAPCHVTVSANGRFALVANYLSGSLCVLPIRRDGSLGRAVEFIQHHGESANRVRQSGPHVHSTTLAEGDRYALVADLGLDRLLAYRFDARRGRLRNVDLPWLSAERGAGPRDLVLAPDGRHAYLVNELDCTVVFLQHDGRGGLRALQRLSTLPEGFTGGNLAAGIALGGQGRFLYVSNRGHDSIAVFRVDPGSGELQPLGHEHALGRTPRALALDPSGCFLLAANQESDTVVSFRIDATSGALRPTGHVAEVPSPVCVLPLVLP